MNKNRKEKEIQTKTQTKLLNLLQIHREVRQSNSPPLLGNLSAALSPLLKYKINPWQSIPYMYTIYTIHCKE